MMHDQQTLQPEEAGVPTFEKGKTLLKQSTSPLNLRTPSYFLQNETKPVIAYETNRD
jgi:hypothetical protein